MFEVHPIGTVKCPVNEMSQGNWAVVDSEIHLESEYAPGFRASKGSHMCWCCSFSTARKASI